MATQGRLWGLVVLVLLAGRTARAQEPDPGVVSARLEWQRGPGAEGCAGADELVAGAERLLGRAAFTTPAAPVVLVRGQVARPAAGRWAAHLVLIGPGGQATGERDLAIAAPDCHALDQSLLIVLALMVDFDRDRVTLRLPEPPPPPPPPPALPPTVVDVESRAAGQATRMVIGVGGVLAHGSLPGFVGGMQARVARALGQRWELEARALFFPPAVEPPTGPGAETWAWQAGLGACRRLAGAGRVRLEACLDGAAGRFSARGVGLLTSRDASGALVDLAVSARVAVSLPGALELRLGAAALAPMVKNRFLSFNPQGQEVLFEGSPIAQRMEIEIGLRSPR